MLRRYLTAMLCAAGALCGFADTPMMAQGLRFRTVGNDCWQDEASTNSVMSGECYALVWKQAGTTFRGLPMVPPNPDRPQLIDGCFWVVDYWPLAERIEDSGEVWSYLSKDVFIDVGHLPYEQATNGTWTVYLLDTRYKKADGTIACGFDPSVTNAPMRINAYTPIANLTDITLRGTRSPLDVKDLTGGDPSVPTIADQRTDAITYQISFDARGGAVEPPSLTLSHGDAYGVLPVPTRTGCEFLGWYTSPDGLVPVTPGMIASSNATVYAQWGCTATFDANGGEASEVVRGFLVGDEVGTLPTAGRTGYAHTGWFTERTGGDKIAADTKVMSNVTYHAQWSANAYGVNFNGRGGDGEMVSQRMTYDVEAALSNNLFRCVGYTFAGWADGEDAVVTKYADGEIVSNLTAEAGGSVDLYAVWQPNAYTVKFNANGGALEMKPQSFVYDQAQTLTANGFRRDGYAFDHWTNAAAQVFYDCAAVSNLTAVADGEVDLVAVWREGDNVVTFDACGGAASKATCSVRTLQSVGELPTAERAGYALAGWFTAAVGGTEVTSETVVTADITYFAHWTPVVYAITYELGGGENAAANPTSYTIETPDITLAAPTRAGYVFAGWTPAGVLEQGSTGDRTFTATWEAALFDEPTAGAISEKGATYNGFLGDDSFAGTFTLVVKKPKKNQAVADATLTKVDPASGKKVKVNGKVDTKTGLGSGGLAGLQLNAQGVGGTLDGVVVQGAVDAAKAKDKSALDVMDDFNKAIYGLAIEDARGEKGYLTVTFSKKGKAKVAGTYGSAKVSGSAQMSVGNGLCALPFVWSKKGMAVTFVLWFDKSTGDFVEVSGLGAGVELVAAGVADVWAPLYDFALDGDDVRASVRDAIPETFNPISVSFNGKKFDAGKAAKVSYKNGVLDVNMDKGANVPGLKLSYSKGTVKGSFTVYAVPNGKLVKNKFTVSGVMVDGEIHAVGTNKNLGSIPLGVTAK